MVRTLVVDGSREQRQAIVEALVRVIGITVQGAVASYSAAVHVLGEITPDLVVMSTELEDGNALELLVALRSESPRPAVIVVGPATQSLTHTVWGADRYVPNDRGVDAVGDAAIELARQRAGAGSAPTSSRRQLAAAAR
jgi:DNA-binding NarL/FixJ family response regulator